MSGSPDELVVSSEHLSGEVLLIDLGHALIVSDHPKWMNGAGKGPNPGELLKGALAASAALAIGELVAREGLRAGHVAVACGSETLTERREDGPLPSTTTLSAFVLRIAVGGELGPGELAGIEAAARDCPIARAVSGEIQIDERRTYDASPAKRDGRGTTYLIEQMRAGRPERGQTRVVAAEQSTRVLAELLDERRVLVTWSEGAYLVEAPGAAADRKRHGGPPEALLLAALSACTSVFTARSAALSGGPVEIRVICSGRFGGRAEEGPSARIEKTVQLTGELSEEQRETIFHFADNCAIGETLRRRARLDVKAELVGAPSAGPMIGDGLRGAFASLAERHLDAAICDDGACCIPEGAAI